MSETKQVNKEHYEFQRYLSKARWNSVWHQLDEVIRLQPESVLEIGPGPGVFKNMATLFGVKVETLDIDPELMPDHVGSVTALPFEDNSYDVVCAFQILEHLPYDVALRAFNEIVRVSRSHVVISLPDAKPVWR
ncbi:MAG TPA: class I SAM-dependent methyltransferase, partial [Gammaproteobacteria bacterium]|nr:class I SAM-dependent methyltransferase [Gammaproteobacteria bacterium]